jgi:hypothetical protein
MAKKIKQGESLTFLAASGPITVPAITTMRVKRIAKPARKSAEARKKAK